MNIRTDVALKENNEGTSGSSPEVFSVFPGELYIKGAHKSFDVTKALNDCFFSANFGEVHAIVGGNGCGKSTLAKVLSGVLPLDSGKISIQGHHPTSPTEARNLGIATVFQEVMIADEATVLDNLFVGVDGFWTKSMSSKEKLSRAGSLMHELIGEKIDLLSPSGNLPLSTKAWITIARALLCEPKILILDESSAALDFDSTERLFKKIHEMRDQGAAIIIVTHRIAELIRVSDRATVMRDGKDVGVLGKSEITEENLLSLMTGREDANTYSNQAHKTASQEVVLKAVDMKVWPESETVNFSLLKGEIIGITGLDGHGQDDFVRILAGVVPASSGFPEFKSSNVKDYVTIKSLDEAKRCGISFVSGDRKREGILPNMSIFENLLISLYRSNTKIPGVRLINWAGLSDIFDWEVERLSIKIGYSSDFITSLSGGNQQKVVIGRSFALHPTILVLNDPARGIDVDTKRELYKHLREFSSEGNSVVYMSSELEELVGFCSRVLVFRNGSFFKTFVNEEVEPVGILEGMFGRTTDSQYNAGGSQLEMENSQTMDKLKSIPDSPALQVEKQQPDPISAKDIRYIRIVEFNDEEQSANLPQDKIKVLHFG